MRQLASVAQIDVDFCIVEGRTMLLYKDGYRSAEALHSLQSIVCRMVELKQRDIQAFLCTRCLSA